MPALLTHYIQADCVYKKSPEEIRQKIDRRAFLWGAQGPDFLYFHRALPIFMPGKPRREVGTTLHMQCADDIMSAFARYCISNQQNQAAFSYACGFVCHYALDCIAHPYVYAQQKNIIKAENAKYFEGYVHSRIEHNLDVIVLRQYKNMAANRFNFDDALCTDKKLLDELGDELEYVSNCFISADEKSVTKSQMIRAFKDTRNLQKFSRDPHGIKHALVRGLERICFYPRSLSTFVRTENADNLWDYANIKHTPWQNPYNEAVDYRVDSFDDLMNLSIDFAINIIKKFDYIVNNGIEYADFTENRSFKTGLKMVLEDVEHDG